MVLDVVRVEKGRWQDDHILIIGHLATLKGDQMKNRNVQIPYELFFQLLQYFLMENYEGEEIIRKGLEKKLNAMVDRELYSKYKNSPNRGRERKSPGRNTWKGREYRKTSLVEILADHFITGACHAPVNIRQGESM